MANALGAEYGVHSEVGQLRKVMVCAPGRAHQRLTLTNCDELLFDDVIWVETAKRDHFGFMQKMRDRGIEVVEMHNLLTQTVAIPEAKKWILNNQVVPNQVGLGLVDEIHSYLEGLPHRELAETLIGGLSTDDFPETHGGEMLKLAREAVGITEYLLPPLPNTIFTRDTTCWIYGGVTVNPLYRPARHEETILMTAIYKFHPDFAGKVNVWRGDPTEDLHRRGRAKQVECIGSRLYPMACRSRLQDRMAFLDQGVGSWIEKIGPCFGSCRASCSSLRARHLEYLRRWRRRNLPLRYLRHSSPTEFGLFRDEQFRAPGAAGIGLCV